MTRTDPIIFWLILAVTLAAFVAVSYAVGSNPVAMVTTTWALVRNTLGPLITALRV